MILNEAVWLRWARLMLVVEGVEAAMTVLSTYLALTEVVGQQTYTVQRPKVNLLPQEWT